MGTKGVDLCITCQHPPDKMLTNQAEKIIWTVDVGH